MKVGTILSAVVVAGLAIGGAIWVGSSGSQSGKDGNGEQEQTGPAPKAVTDDTLLEFGAVEVNERREHTFTITNGGDAPLQLTNGGTSCSVCTKNLFVDATVQPGESVDVPIEWTPDKHEEEFRKHYYIGTNDPNRPQVVFTIEGRVDQRLHLEPRNWDQGVVDASTEFEVKGKFYSRVYAELPEPVFELGEGVVSGEATELDPGTIDSLQAKTGYELKFVVQSAKSGGFTREVLMKVAVDPPVEVPLKITGRSSGPLTILPLNNVDFSKRRGLVDMGSFDAATGKSVQLGLVFKNAPDDFVAEVAAAGAPLEVTLEKDRTYRIPNRQKHILTITFPAGGKASARLDVADLLNVSVRNNHPDLELIKLQVRYVAK